MHWKKKCWRCLLSKKEHKKPYPKWWDMANIPVHEWIAPKAPPKKRVVHLAPKWNMYRRNTGNVTVQRLIPLCFKTYVEGQSFGYNPDDDPFAVNCKKCIRWYLEGTSAQIENDAKRARIQKRKEKEERLRRKRAKRSKVKASRKTGKKFRKGEEREVRLRGRKSKRRSRD